MAHPDQHSCILVLCAMQIKCASVHTVSHSQSWCSPSVTNHHRRRWLWRQHRLRWPPSTRRRYRPTTAAGCRCGSRRPSPGPRTPCTCPEPRSTCRWRCSSWCCTAGGGARRAARATRARRRPAAPRRRAAAGGASSCPSNPSPHYPSSWHAFGLSAVCSERAIRSPAPIFAAVQMHRSKSHILVTRYIETMGDSRTVA